MVELWNWYIFSTVLGCCLIQYSTVHAVAPSSSTVHAVTPSSSTVHAVGALVKSTSGVAMGSGCSYAMIPCYLIITVSIKKGKPHLAVTMNLDQELIPLGSRF